ncbi:hypothetical protein CFP56_040843 [Quercus suber]|uniref:Protein FAR1-RELATED SEQUENCE n=1 Tax=Quercus suber TaxID=58331 RepID=A0AAW0IWN7_QUESU
MCRAAAFLVSRLSTSVSLWVRKELTHRRQRQRQRWRQRAEGKGPRFCRKKNLALTHRRRRWRQRRRQGAEVEAETLTSFPCRRTCYFSFFLKTVKNILRHMEEEITSASRLVELNEHNSDNKMKDTVDLKNNELNEDNVENEKDETRKVPNKYILKRWYKNIKRSHTKVRINYDNRLVKLETQRFAKMYKVFNEVADLAVDSEDKCEKVVA